MKIRTLRPLLLLVFVLPACVTYQGEREPETSFARVVGQCSSSSSSHGTFIGELTIRGPRNVEKAVRRRGGHIACEDEWGSEEMSTTNVSTTTIGRTELLAA